MVTMSLNGMDLGTFFKAVNSGVLNINDEGVLECKEKVVESKEVVNTLKDEILSRDEKIKELEKIIVELKQGEAVFDTKEVENLNNENMELRETLSQLVKAHENLSEKFQDLQVERDNLLKNNGAMESLQKENEGLKNQLAQTSNVSNLQDSQDYKDLVESNKLLESTANRLTQENEALQKELALLKTNPSTSNDKVLELEGRLKKAQEVFAAQKKEIETLKSSGGVDIASLRAEIEKEVKDKANAKLKEQWEKLIEQKDRELDEKVKELSAIQRMEIDKKNAQIKELESKVYSQNNAKGVPFSLVDFVDKAFPMIENQINPTQRKLVNQTLKEMARDLTEQYNQDNKEKISDIPLSEKVVSPDEKGNPPIYEQEQLPF